MPMFLESYPQDAHLTPEQVLGDKLAEVRELAENHKKISAIKVIKAVTGQSLKWSKYWYEWHFAQYV